MMLSVCHDSADDNDDNTLTSGLESNEEDAAPPAALPIEQKDPANAPVLVGLCMMPLPSDGQGKICHQSWADLQKEVLARLTLGLKANVLNTNVGGGVSGLIKRHARSE
jgi:hypothetical protein